MAREEYYSGIEPDVIIHDDSDDYLEDTIEDDIRKIKAANKELGPEVSLIPVKKTPSHIKLMHFYNEISITKTFKEEPAIASPPLSSTGESIIHGKRKSLPLEKCPICKKFFRRMNTHLQKHAESQQLQTGQVITCQYCPKLFNSMSNLTIHMRTHTVVKPYVCEICSKGFTQTCNLVNHMRIHTGERPFKCPHCERAFTQSGNLGNHIRLHLDQKPFQCHFCDRAFTQSGNLNSHIRNNHKNENIQKYI